MAKFLIEVPHGGTMAECTRAIDVFLRSGSHFLTHADWGCKDGEHKAWIVLEVDSKEAELFQNGFSIAVSLLANRRVRQLLELDPLEVR